MQTTRDQIKELKKRMMNHEVSPGGEAIVTLTAIEVQRIVTDLEVLADLDDAEELAHATKIT